MPFPFCVYILFSKKDFQLYTGFTSNLKARIKKHNSGGNISTSYRRPLVLIFCEFYLFEEDARKRESYFKTTMGKKVLKLMLRSSFEKMGYKNLSLKSLQVIYDGENREDEHHVSKNSLNTALTQPEIKKLHGLSWNATIKKFHSYSAFLFTHIWSTIA